QQVVCRCVQFAHDDTIGGREKNLELAVAVKKGLEVCSDDTAFPVARVTDMPVGAKQYDDLVRQEKPACIAGNVEENELAAEDEIRLPVEKIFGVEDDGDIFLP